MTIIKYENYSILIVRSLHIRSPVQLFEEVLSGKNAKKTNKQTLYVLLELPTKNRLA